MPTIFNPNQNLDENGNPIPEVSNSTNSNVVDSGSSEPKDNKAPTSSGSFTNLKSYLDANKDSQFGSQFANRVGAVGDEAAGVLDSSKQSVTSKIDSGKVNYNPELVEKAVNDPSKFVQDQNNVQQFTAQRDAQYKGPKQFNETEEFGQSQKAVEKATQTAEASKTGHGRQALMGDFFARPDYYAGMKRLDNLIVQNDPNARQQLQQAQQKVEPIQSNFKNLGDYISGYASQADAATKAARKQTRDALGLQDDGTINGGAIGELDGRISERLTNRLDEYDQNVPAITNALASADLTQLTPQQRAALGLDSVELDGLWGVDLGDSRFYKRPGRSDLTKSSVASADESARIAALSQLAGVENIFAPDQSLAGRYDDESLYGFDVNSFKDAVNSSRADLINKAVPQQIDISRLLGEVGGRYARNAGGAVDTYAKDGVLKRENLDAFRNAWLTDGLGPDDGYYTPEQRAGIAAQFDKIFSDPFKKPEQDLINAQRKLKK